MKFIKTNPIKNIRYFFERQMPALIESIEKLAKAVSSLETNNSGQVYACCIEYSPPLSMELPTPIDSLRICDNKNSVLKWYFANIEACESDGLYPLDVESGDVENILNRLNNTGGFRRNIYRGGNAEHRDYAVIRIDRMNINEEG